MTLPARGGWTRALAALETSRLKALAAEVSQQLAVEPRVLPQAGLRLLHMTDGVLGQGFYLGEIPVASAAVLLEHPSGARAEGGAELMGDDAELATALAILDGVLAGRLPGWERVAGALEQGQALCDRADALRASALAQSTVDFGTMASPDEDEHG
jgi:alpha-D-ribose 1-methylphosphonate 5-triphosphate synthase subunit PhnG